MPASRYGYGIYGHSVLYGQGRPRRVQPQQVAVPGSGSSPTQPWWMVVRVVGRDRHGADLTLASSTTARLTRGSLSASAS
jgi:hypothetical protein